MPDGTEERTRGETIVDAKKFDALVAKLASGPSRREALQGLVGGALSVVSVSTVALGKGKSHGEGSPAGTHKKGGDKRRAKAEACTPNNRLCDCKESTNRRPRR